MNEAKFQKLLTRLRDNDSTLTALPLSGIPLSGEQISALAKALETNTTATELDLSRAETWEKVPWGCRNFTAEDLQPVFTALAKNKTVTHLNLACNGLGEAGPAALVALLQANQTLRELNLTTAIFNRKGEYLQRFLEGLSQGCSLTTLKLRDNIQYFTDKIGEPFGAALQGFLEANPQLESLDLSHNNLTNHVIEQLAVGLAENGVLSVLNLSENKIEADSSLEVGIGYFAFSLRKLRCRDRLTELDVSGNVLMPFMVARLVESLTSSCPNLEVLNLSNTRAGKGTFDCRSDAAEACAALLKRNKNLRRVNLENNQFNGEAMACLLPALASTTLHSLLLAGNQVGEKGNAKQFLTALRENRWITEVSLPDGFPNGMCVDMDCKKYVERNKKALAEDAAKKQRDRSEQASHLPPRDSAQPFCLRSLPALSGTSGSEVGSALSGQQGGASPSLSTYSDPEGPRFIASCSCATS